MKNQEAKARWREANPLTPEQREAKRASDRKSYAEKCKDPRFVEAERQRGVARGKTPKRKASKTASGRRVNTRKRLAREARTKRLGKLLNLSVNGATEHERRLARQKYNQLKERRSVA